MKSLKILSTTIGLILMIGLGTTARSEVFKAVNLEQAKNIRNALVQDYANDYPCSYRTISTIDQFFELTLIAFVAPGEAPPAKAGNKKLKAIYGGYADCLRAQQQEPAPTEEPSPEPTEQPIASPTASPEVEVIAEDTTITGTTEATDNSTAPAYTTGSTAPTSLEAGLTPNTVELAIEGTGGCSLNSNVVGSPSTFLWMFSSLILVVASWIRRK
ncbi:MAG: hypothetical protein HYU97_08370 [Deltaproteobacteria bacterium]|nr:hypothetical protein [Deltaproteobacteria bacterium]